jgi:hypothetical protein
MGEKVRDLKPTTLVPGSGEYDPKHQTIKKQLPSYSMKQKLGSSLASSTGFVPGPGNYIATMTNKKDAPKYGFGSSKRDNNSTRRLNVPGPGSYKLKSTIGDVPDYAMPNRKDENKFV